MPTTTERGLAALIYIISFFSAIIGPLIIWLIQRSQSDFIDYHGKQYINFFISYAIYSAVASLTMFILIGFVLLPLVGLLMFIFTIIAAVKAYQGEEYRIPFVIRIFT